MSTSDLTVAARLVAKLLAHRQTPQEEVVGVIRGVHAALSRLSEHDAVASAPVAKPDQPQATPRPRRRRRQPEQMAPLDDPAPATPPPTPRLVRRAEVMAAPPVPTATPPIAPAPDAAVRGVVKWFDPRAGKGALRLPGFSGDVLFEASILADAGIARLIQAQEVKATILGSNCRQPQVQRIPLPRLPPATPPAAGSARRVAATPATVLL